MHGAFCFRPNSPPLNYKSYLEFCHLHFLDTVHLFICQLATVSESLQTVYNTLYYFESQGNCAHNVPDIHSEHFNRIRRKFNILMCFGWPYTQSTLYPVTFLSLFLLKHEKQSLSEPTKNKQAEWITSNWFFSMAHESNSISEMSFRTNIALRLCWTFCVSSRYLSLIRTKKRIENTHSIVLRTVHSIPH